MSWRGFVFGWSSILCVLTGCGLLLDADPQLVRGSALDAGYDLDGGARADRAERDDGSTGRRDAAPDGGTTFACVPRSEICNGLDDDCDMLVDEDFDFMSDVSNCGGCGTACVASGTNAYATCVMGTCTSTCRTGYADCAGDGVCVSLSTAAHCGSCSVTCPLAAPLCSLLGGEACRTYCDTALRLCSSVCADTATDPMNCGDCGNVCLFDHAAGLCVSGHCQLGACDPGYDDCDMDADTGCETDTGASSTDCGSCGRTCVGRCSAGSCVSATTCTRPCLDCGSGSCDVDVDYDDLNCGGCGMPCGAAQRCCGGMCRPSGFLCTYPLPRCGGA